jgi:hypothetical protein
LNIEVEPACPDNLGLRLIQAAVLPALPFPIRPAPLPEVADGSQNAPPAPAPQRTASSDIPQSLIAPANDPPAPAPILMQTPNWQFVFPAPKPEHRRHEVIIHPRHRVRERAEGFLPVVDRATSSSRCEDGDCKTAEHSQPSDCLIEAAEQLEAGGLGDLADAVRKYARAADQKQTRQLLDRKLKELEALQAEIAGLQGQIVQERQILLGIKMIECDPEKLQRLGIDFTKITNEGDAIAASGGKAPCCVS